MDEQIMIQPVFPPEILMQIMNKIPNEDKTNFMQTCKLLYRYGSELLSYRSPLMLYSEQLEDEYLVISITESLRRFRTIKIKMKELCGIKFFNLLRILAVHGPHIEKLSWDFLERIIMTPQEILAILSKTPNIQRLFVSGLRSFFLDDSWPEDAALCSLTKLKSIDLHHTPKGWGKLLTKLPTNTVSVLKFTGILDDFGDILLHHASSLKELTISEKCVDPHLFRCLKLERLFYRVSDDNIAVYLSSAQNRFIVDVIRNQPALKHLQLCSHSSLFNCGGAVFQTSFELSQAIFKLAQLEVLEMGPTRHSLQGISRLKNLKSLSFQDCGDLTWDHSVLRELSQVKFQNLEKLDLFCCETQLSEYLFEGLGTCCPNLKSLVVTNDEVSTLNSYFNKFPKLESLEVGCFKDNFHSFNYDGKTHMLLKSLFIMNEVGNGQLLRVPPSLFEALPNLHEIYIATPVRYDIAVLRALVESNMKKISIHFEYSEPELIYTTETELMKQLEFKTEKLDVVIEKQRFFEY